jgi:hypothetical protein
VDPYSINTVFEKPTSPINVDEEGLGMDNVVDMDEDDLQRVGEYAEQQRGGQRGVARRKETNEDDGEEDPFVFSVGF